MDTAHPPASFCNPLPPPAGSMRGAREVVAKALALECMRAAKAQERGCYVFAFAGPQEVRHGGQLSHAGLPAAASLLHPVPTLCFLACQPSSPHPPPPPASP